MADDLNFQDLSSVASDHNSKPKTVASATTIAPTTFLTVVTGTLQVGTITPPTTGHCMVGLIFTDASPGVTLTTGNIAIATTVVSKKLLLLAYNPIAAKWYPSY